MRDSWNGQESNYFTDNSSRFEDISLEAADGDEELMGEILRLLKNGWSINESNFD